MLSGHLYHVTHRCHDRSFLLKFARDRNCYRDWLREAIARYKVSVLGYCLTCNHIHLILASHALEDISQFMQLVQSRSAQQYNRRKNRKGAYWEDRYSCTMIDSGRFLWNCLQYVDLNMVRAGVVNHPAEWAWCGYREFMGLRERYRILDVGTLLTMLGYADLAKTRVYYRSELEKQIARGGLTRDPIWAESLAVGDRSFIDAVKKSVSRTRTYMTEGKTPEGTKVWSIREAGGAYG